MRVILFTFLLLVHSLVQAGESKERLNGSQTVHKRLFVSFSMPENLLKQSMESAEKLNVTLVFNGLIENSMRATAERLSILAKAYPELSIQIDPVAFEDFNIEDVPALVVNVGDVFDVLSGNIDLMDALTLINARGDLKGRVL